MIGPECMGQIHQNLLGDQVRSSRTGGRIGEMLLYKLIASASCLLSTFFFMRHLRALPA